jgi:hypothetical protein
MDDNPNSAGSSATSQNLSGLFHEGIHMLLTAILCLSALDSPLMSAPLRFLEGTAPALGLLLTCL